MLLNLLLIQSKMQDCKILQCTAKKETPLTLKRVQKAAADTKYEESILYIVPAEELPLAVPDGRLSLITIGYPPAAYMDSDRCELLCFSVNTNLSDLFQKVLDIFYYYADIEDNLKDLIIAGAEIRDLAELAFHIFGTPMAIYGLHEKILMISFDSSHPENRDYYLEYSGCEYVPEDERSVLYKTPAFVETFHNREVGFSKMDVYHTEIIYKNIFNEDTYLGRVTLENSYRPFSDADYCLVEWFSKYIKILMNKSKPFQFQTSHEFEGMIRELVMSGAPYREGSKKILNDIGWELNDQYLIVQISTLQPQNSEPFLTEGAYYLKELFDSQYILMQPSYLFQLINLTKSIYSYAETMRRLDIFMKNNAMIASTSSLFSDFSQIDLHIRQAKLMSAFALADREHKLYEYDSYVKRMMLFQMRGQNSPLVYLNQHMLELYSYDKKANSDLMHTLKCYLSNNLNLSRTSQDLYIARTTCLYRIHKICSIAHIDLEDRETVEYLRLVTALL